MSNLINRLKAAWHFWRFYPSTQLPLDYWRDEDARALSNFLCSDSGIKLRKIWLDEANQASLRAIMDSSSQKYLAGIAWAERGKLTRINELLRISPPSSELVELTERQLEGEFRSVNR